MFKVVKLKSKCRVNIGGEMNIYAASELKEKFMALLDDSRPLEINLSDVTEMDSSGVQLLMLLKKECDQKNRKLSLTHHSDAVLDVFELLRLSAYFNDPVLLQKTQGE